MSEVRVEELRIASADRVVVDGLSLDARRGELVALCGESGAGKTTVAHAVLGHVRPGLRLLGGSVRVGGTEVLTADARALRGLRAGTVGFVGQAAAGALDPVLRVGRQLAEAARAVPRERRGQAVRAALRAAGLPDDGALLRRHAHELSGGQQQRVAIALALVTDPAVLVLDEPTTGLDTTTQAHVLDTIGRLRDDGRSVLMVCHDLALVAERADEVVIMRSGRLVEQGPAREVLGRPSHEYTRSLRDAAPDHARQRLRLVPAPTTELLRVEGLGAEHGSRRQRTVAARDVTFTLGAGRCLALVGESGSGKTTIARCFAGLHRPSAGTVRLDGEELAADVRRRRQEHLRAVQLIGQDPADTLNPRVAAGRAVERPLQLFERLVGARLRSRRDELLEQVGLGPDHAARRPRDLSGGERQRIAIARALAASPRLLLCDEVTTALDASSQAVVVDVLDGLREHRGVAILLVTHDLGLAGALAEETLVLRRGEVVEHRTTADVLADPQGSYTKALVASSPSISRVLQSHDDAARAPSSSEVDVLGPRDH